MAGKITPLFQNLMTKISLMNRLISELTQIWTQDALSASLLISFASLLKVTQLAAKPKINGEMEAV